MATGEIDFHDAFALPIEPVEDGIHLVMDNVLHLSRLFNSFCVLGMGRRAYGIARAYANHRKVFGQTIKDYPLVKENLARIKSENMAMTSGIFATAKLQDKYDTGNATAARETSLLLRLLVNIQKYLSARWSVEHIHHSLDVLAGNGTIEIFSPLPRLLRDAIVCENWEGTHNVLRMQVLKDILKFNLDAIFIVHMQTEMQKMDKYSQHLHPVAAALSVLKEELSEFRDLDPELQSLRIRHIVDQMAIIYCAMMLLGEAIDQTKNKLSFSKLDCYNYFCMLHIDKNELSYDKDYLELISRIIQ
jgi:acyl-CoA dehydrogenase